MFSSRTSFLVLVGRHRCKSIECLRNCVEVSVVDDVISGGHDDDDWISTVDAVDVSVESDDTVVTLHDIEGDVSGFAYEIEGKLVCAMIVYVVRTVGASVLLLLGHDDMGLSGRCIRVSGDVSIECSMGSVCGMIGVIYPQTLTPHNKDGDSGLLREVDAVPCASGSVALWVIGKRKAEIGSQFNHLLVADGASGSAVLLSVGSMDLSLEIEQALSVESSFGVCACCATVYGSGALLGLLDDLLHSDE